MGWLRGQGKGSSLSDRKGSLLTLLLVMLAINLAYPGEVFLLPRFWFLAITPLLFLTVLWKDRVAPDSLPLLKESSLLLGLLVWASLGLAFTINFKRTEEVLCLTCGYFCTYLLVRWLRIPSGMRQAAVFIFAQIAFAICLFSLYQYFFELNDLKRQILESAIDPAFRGGLLGRIGTRRVFAHFPLPNTLAGYLAMMLPLQAYFMLAAFTRSQRNVHAEAGWLSKILHSSWWKWLFPFQCLLSLVVLGMTKSFGGMVCVLVSTVVPAMALIRIRKVARRTILWGMLLLIIFGAAGQFYLIRARGFALWDFAHPENPMVLRWINFKTALRIFEDFPWTGIGLGNFGVINPVYQIKPEQVTQYAHNTPLQIVAEGGFLLIAGMVIFGFLWHRQRMNSRRERDAAACGFSLRDALLTSLVACLVHNLLDINFYFLSLGSVSFLLLAFWIDSNSASPGGSTGRADPGLPVPTEGIGQIPSPRSRPFLVWGMTLVVGLSLLAVLRGALTDSLLQLALAASRAQEHRRAHAYAETARRWRSYDADATLLETREAVASIQVNPQNRRESLEILLRGYLRATVLDPYNAHYHFELSRIQAALGEQEAAARSRMKAIQLFPSEPSYRK